LSESGAGNRGSGVGTRESGLGSRDSGIHNPKSKVQNRDRVIKPASAAARCASAKVYDLRPVRDLLIAARRALEEAKVQAEQIRRKAHREGIEAGRTEGIEQGRIEGIKRGLAEADDVRATLAALIDDLQRHRAALKADAEHHLIDLALAVAARVVKGHIDLDASVVRRNITAAVELVAAADRLRILVAPEDVQTVKDFLPDLASRLQIGSAFGGSSSSAASGGSSSSSSAANASADTVELVPDPDVTRGGCVIRTAGGEVDAQIETQLEEIQRQLKE